MKKFFRQRKAQRQVDAYNYGFGWAMTAYYVERKTLFQISTHHKDSTSSFNNGVLHALRILRDQPPQKNINQEKNNV